ncbi:381_t:CDS:1, partial [Gigaspora margarita]
GLNNPFIYRKFMEYIPKIREGDKKKFLILWSNVLFSINQKRVVQKIQFNDCDQIAFLISEELLGHLTKKKTQRYQQSSKKKKVSF